MQVNVIKEDKKHTLRDISNGQVFAFEGKYFLMCQMADYNYAVNLVTGIALRLTDLDQQAQPCEASVTVYTA